MVSTPTVGEKGVMLLMARIEKSSVPVAAAVTVSCSSPSWPFRNSLAVWAPPVCFSSAAMKARPKASCVPPAPSPTAILKSLAAAGSAAATASAQMAAPWRRMDARVIR